MNTLLKLMLMCTLIIVVYNCFCKKAEFAESDGTTGTASSDSAVTEYTLPESIPEGGVKVSFSVNMKTLHRPKDCNNYNESSPVYILVKDVSLDSNILIKSTGSDNKIFQMTTSDNNVYSLDLLLQKNKEFEYKYLVFIDDDLKLGEESERFVPLNCNSGEISNGFRKVSVVNDDITLRDVYWNYCSSENPINFVSVKFELDTSNIKVDNTAQWYIVGPKYGFFGPVGFKMSKQPTTGIHTANVELPLGIHLYRFSTHTSCNVEELTDATLYGQTTENDNILTSKDSTGYAYSKLGKPLDMQGCTRIDYPESYGTGFRYIELTNEDAKSDAKPVIISVKFDKCSTGCTYEDASNYDRHAMLDDGTCTFGDIKESVLKQKVNNMENEISKYTKYKNKLLDPNTQVLNNIYILSDTHKQKAEKFHRPFTGFGLAECLEVSDMKKVTEDKDYNIVGYSNKTNTCVGYTRGVDRDSLRPRSIENNTKEGKLFSDIDSDRFNYSMVCTEDNKKILDTSDEETKNVKDLCIPKS